MATDPPALAPSENSTGNMSEAEAKVRTELAACYRLIAHYRMTDLTYTHISARVPGREEHFLLNAFGLMFDEITASNLVKIDLDGNIVDDATGLGVNSAGFLIHSAIHGARPDIGCVLHVHTPGGMAVSAQREGLMPLTQHAMRFYGRLAYHDYEGIVVDSAERERLARDLGPHKAMILRNHGLLTCGETVAEAFSLMWYLERACQAQVGALSGGGPLHRPSQASIDASAAIFAGPEVRAGADQDFKALLRMLGRIAPDFRD